MSAGPRVLCTLADLPPGTARGFDEGIFAVGSHAGAVVYRNACPHLGIPLDWAPDRFLSADGSVIMCGTHGAEFRIDTGECLRGPCVGEFLHAVPFVIKDAKILLAPGHPIAAKS